MHRRQKIGSYFLSDNTKHKMLELSRRSARTKTEQCFKLCLNDKDKNITSGIPCQGEDISKSECKKDEKYIGTFYAHTRYTFNPSIEDLRNGYLDLMSCVGIINDIKCFKRKKEDFDISEYNDIKLVENKKNLSILNSKEAYGTEYSKELEIHRKEIKRLIDSYFDVINIKR